MDGSLARGSRKNRVLRRQDSKRASSPGGASPDTEIEELLLPDAGMRWLRKAPIDGFAGPIGRAAFPLVTRHRGISASHSERGRKRSSPTQLRGPRAERSFVLVPHEKARA